MRLRQGKNDAAPARKKLCGSGKEKVMRLRKGKNDAAQAPRNIVDVNIVYLDKNQQDEREGQLGHG
jgi:hypothetical protein